MLDCYGCVFSFRFCILPAHWKPCQYSQHFSVLILAIPSYLLGISSSFCDFFFLQHWLVVANLMGYTWARWHLPSICDCGGSVTMPLIDHASWQYLFGRMFKCSWRLPGSLWFKACLGLLCLAKHTCTLCYGFPPHLWLKTFRIEKTKNKKKKVKNEVFEVAKLNLDFCQL